MENLCCGILTLSVKIWTFRHHHFAGCEPKSCRYSKICSTGMEFSAYLPPEGDPAVSGMHLYLSF